MTEVISVFREAIEQWVYSKHQSALKWAEVLFILVDYAGIKSRKPRKK